uniref:Uncharacterized protein n=1 Tax=Panagrolaimus sp. PS1159 TaxID=55785 RepID=A0AC35GSG6_9BILA
MNRVVIALIIAFFAIFTLGFLYTYFAEESDDYWQPLTSDLNDTFNTFESSNSDGNILLDFCDLTELDPWDPTIVSFIWQQEDPSLKCKPKVEQISQLINGQLYLSPQPANVTCLWRCLYPKDDYSINFEKWNELINGSKPFCDIVEVECKAPKKPKPFYKFLHAQIFRLDATLSSRESPTKYDVHIILFDSVSESQFVRSMPKTRHVLREYYESISFRHLNKIGLNSRPNGFGLLLGKSIYNIAKSPMSKGYESDYKNNEYFECKSTNESKKAKPFYKFLHAQIFRLDATLSSRESPTKYDVHIILFDSVSESQFVRSMPKTRHVLREYYESISFRHLNKIG